jgi:rhamnopyranosyl-N-acetylglucosaminyl-diphospho-decaprenol beta-1,3/1,4-galactofuranosyltransferase
VSRSIARSDRSERTHIPNRRVVALIVTFQRRNDLLATIAAVQAQSRPVDHIVVVDNSTDFECRGYLSSSDVELVATRANLGYSGGLSAGLARILLSAEKQAATHVWILDDDSPVGPQSLERALRQLDRLPALASLGNRGFIIRWDGIWVRDGGEQPVPAEASLVDGGIFPLSVIKDIGPPRSDFFMVFEDAEFTLRVSRAGYPLFVSDAVETVPLHRGSEGCSQPWRGYYQTRNSIRAAIDLRHRRLLVAVIARLTKQTVWLLLRGDKDRWKRITLRLKGLKDGLVDDMGITITPDDAT